MPTLFEAPDAPTLTLIRTVADGREQAGLWPVWQWVSRQLADRDLDPEQVLRNAPTWPHYYRSVVPENGPNSIPDPGHRMRLTVHGLVHGDGAETDRLLRQFIQALSIAASMQATSPVEPGQLRAVVIGGPELAKGVEARLGGTCDVAVLGTMLRGEPSTWSGLTGDTASVTWGWDLTARSLRRFAHVRSGEDYLIALDGFLGSTAAIAVHDVYLPPNALPDAIDFLEVTWRLATHSKLFHLRRTSAIGRLVLDCNSADEFESRCSALADVLNMIDLSGEGAPLQRLRQHLEGLLQGEILMQAIAAVDVLRRIVALRAGQQHSGADMRAARAARELGLPQNGDWNETWRSLSWTAVTALSSLREALASLLPD